MKKASLLFLFVAAVSCSPRAPQTSTTPTRATAERESTTSTPATWGGLSEREFKKLHELSKDEVPALEGDDLEVGGAKAYLSLPEGEPKAGIVVIHEWWGLNDHIKHWADRLASAGYAALAVDLYGGTVATTRDEAMAAMKSVDEKQAMAVLQAAHKFLAEDERVGTSKRAVIGWCFGGGWSLQHALATEDLDVAVIYYGRLVTEPEKLKAIHASVIGIFGNQDQGIPPDQVDAFEAALEKAGVKHEIYRFDANHAFANPSGARYDHDAAAKAWKKVSAFLEAELGG